eukprot:g36898.t1
MFTFAIARVFESTSVITSPTKKSSPIHSVSGARVKATATSFSRTRDQDFGYHTTLSREKKHEIISHSPSRILESMIKLKSSLAKANGKSCRMT